MIIAVDLDGIVVDFHGSLRNELIKTINYDLFSKPAPFSYFVDEWPEVKAIPNGPKEVNRLASIPITYQKALPVKKSLSSLSLLKKMGHDLWFVTARPKNLTQTTKDWFKKYSLDWGIEKIIICDALFSDRAKAKSIACQKIKANVIIDDHAETIRNIVCPSLKLKLLLAYPWNISEKVGPNAYFCQDWTEIVKKISFLS